MMSLLSLPDFFGEGIKHDEFHFARHRLPFYPRHTVFPLGGNPVVPRPDLLRC